jgi:hypothetical protein
VCIQASGPTATKVSEWALETLLQPGEDEIYLVPPVTAIDDESSSKSKLDSVSSYLFGFNKGSSVFGALFRSERRTSAVLASTAASSSAASASPGKLANVSIRADACLFESDSLLRAAGTNSIRRVRATGPDPTAAAVYAAGEYACDLVVIASATAAAPPGGGCGAGWQALWWRLLGLSPPSSSAYALYQATCPVLLVPSTAAVRRRTKARIQSRPLFNFIQPQAVPPSLQLGAAAAAAEASREGLGFMVGQAWAGRNGPAAAAAASAALVPGVAAAAIQPRARNWDGWEERPGWDGRGGPGNRGWGGASASLVSARGGCGEDGLFGGELIGELAPHGAGRRQRDLTGAHAVRDFGGAAGGSGWAVGPDGGEDSDGVEAILARLAAAPEASACSRSRRAGSESDHGHYSPAAGVRNGPPAAGPIAVDSDSEGMGAGPGSSGGREAGRSVGTLAGMSVEAMGGGDGAGAEGGGSGLGGLRRVRTRRCLCDDSDS